MILITMMIIIMIVMITSRIIVITIILILMSMITDDLNELLEDNEMSDADFDPVAEAFKVQRLRSSLSSD
jgi:hypothetical protein